MIRCLSLGLLFVASSIGLSLLFSGVSNAQSAYDNAYQVTDFLYLENSFDENAERYEVTDNWQAFFQNVNPVNDKNLIYRYNNQNYSFGSPEIQAMIDLVADAPAFAVSNYRISNGYEIRIALDYTEEKTLLFSELGSMKRVHIEPDNNQLVSIRIFENNQAINIVFDTSNTAFTVSNDVAPGTNGSFVNFLVAGFDVVYPENYNGQEIRDIYPTQDKTFLPEWTWSVTESGKLTVTSQNNENANLDADAVFDLWKDSKDWQFPSVEVVDSEMQRPYHSAKFEHQLVKEEQWFTITLQYYDLFCLMEGTCESELPEGITHIETVIFQIYWDGKSFIAGNNANGQEDCELQEDGGIYRRVCNAEDQEPVIMRTLRGLNSDMHGLTQIITAPLSFITSLITYNNNCTALSLPLPSAMNRDLNLPCMTPYYQQYLGFLFNLYQTILTALVCYYCFVNTLAYVKRGQNPKNDRIEVAHL